MIPNSMISVSSSESNVSEERNLETVEDIEPEVNQDHYASPLQRQSTKDGAKLFTGMAMFMLCFVNPLSFMASKTPGSSAGSFKSRHLLGFGAEQPTSPQYFLVSNVINIVMSFFLLMFMLLRGNPRCSTNSKVTMCYQSQLRKAQQKISKHEYEDAKGFLRIALFVLGDSCPKTSYGQFASFMWKCCCHMLYQLGVKTALESIGCMILPKSVSLVNEKQDQEYVAKLSAQVYRKLHEVSLKDPSSTYLEAACYLMNMIYSAEVSGDHELLCTAYATAVIHMREKVWLPSLFQYYFTGCAHHVSLASKDGYPFAVDWIFESRGYEYFVNGTWDVKCHSQFYVHNEDSPLDEADLLQMVYAQFQEYLLLKALKRIVVPETFYLNEGKIELRQRALSFLDSLGTGPVSEHLDNVSIYQQSLYGWCGAALKQLLDVRKNGVSKDKDQLFTLNYMFDDIEEGNRHSLLVLMKDVISCYVSVQLLKHDIESDEISTSQIRNMTFETSKQLTDAAQALALEQDKAAEMKDEDNCVDVSELLLLMCIELMIEARYMMWQVDRSHVVDDDLELMTQQNQFLHLFAPKYRELSLKIERHDFEIQSMSGLNLAELSQITRRAKNVYSVNSRNADVDCIYYNQRQYPVKQGGFPS